MDPITWDGLLMSVPRSRFSLVLIRSIREGLETDPYVTTILIDRITNRVLTGGLQCTRYRMTLVIDNKRFTKK